MDIKELNLVFILDAYHEQTLQKIDYIAAYV